MRNYYNLHALQINMADACEPEPSSDCSDSISGNNSSFYAESSSSKKNLQYEEPRTSSLFMERKSCDGEESNIIFKTVSKTEFCEKDRASFEKQ